LVEALPVDIVWFEREVGGFDDKENTKKEAIFIESLTMLTSIERLSPMNHRKHFQFKKSIMLHIYPKVHLHSMRKGTILSTSQAPTVISVFSYAPKVVMITSNASPCDVVTAT
jgi:hypothetical protein